MAEIWTLKNSKMATMVPKLLPVINMGVISLSSEFQPGSSSNSLDMDIKKIQDGHGFKMATIVPKQLSVIEE